MRYFITPNKKLIYSLEHLDLEKTALILCSSYEIDVEKLALAPKKLILYFDDVLEGKNNAFCEELAGKVKDFVSAFSETVTDLYLCCDSGESRSAALCAALMRSFGQDEMEIWKNPHYHPNLLVYRLMCSALGMKTSKLGLRYRAYISQNALKKAIRKKKKESLI